MLDVPKTYKSQLIETQFWKYEDLENNPTAAAHSSHAQLRRVTDGSSPFRSAKQWMTKRVIPDYTNQLDLFSEAVEETPAPVADAQARSSGFQSRPRPPEQMRFLDLVPLPPEDGVRTPSPKPASAINGGNGRTAQPLLFQPDTDAHDEPSRRETTDVQDVPIGKVFDIEPEVRPSRDFRITAQHRIGEGSLQEKARDNIAAIRLLKTLEAENRDATDDEKAVLARYVGWGAMPNAFGHYPPPDWKGTAGAVKELLTDAEFQSARASTPNAHYTSPLVIEAIWSGLQRMGLGPSAQMLEPAMGVGHFFGLMPEGMQGGQRTGVELDSITARIAKKLYPDATIFAKGFEETPLPDNYFDAVVPIMCHLATTLCTTPQ